MRVAEACDGDPMKRVVGAFGHLVLNNDRFEIISLNLRHGVIEVSAVTESAVHEFAGSDGEDCEFNVYGDDGALVRSIKGPLTINAYPPGSFVRIDMRWQIGPRMSGLDS
jgi:hypothetical protein